jgi:hypothetical protein
VADGDGDGREGERVDERALGAQRELDAARGADPDGCDRQGGPLPDPDGEPGGVLEQREPRRRARRVRDGGDAESVLPRDGRGGLPSPALGRGTDGIPAWLGVPAAAGAALARWPAGEGREPGPEEPARVTAEPGPYWAEQLRAIGNAVVPACAMVAGLVLREWMEET